MSKSIMPAWFARHVLARRGRAGAPPTPPASPASPAGEPDAAREPERLERIACYARAGYFNMGYTPDMYPFVGDLPPH
ncbi:hypothetical protein [Paraburkholderia lycopersici]|uniref:Uncharacterized protein n=1 Tax=Paraburkholderia lycopersici TaxID=416944 RepID=A0A1G6TJI2_9BURK|nr:hypothetical protein [Paraburkholderia lycopersici]SDD29248.1 hypothetical protein SAMN05421548_11762 [Paraburkholderia lycopersici]